MAEYHANENHTDHMLHESTTHPSALLQAKIRIHRRTRIQETAQRGRKDFETFWFSQESAAGRKPLNIYIYIYVYIYQCMYMAVSILIKLLGPTPLAQREYNNI